MRFWLSKSSEVPIREQLATQLILGIASNDLKPGQKLPSTREMARRFRIHANTVSAVYSDLARRGWVDFRKGSGVYVRAFEDRARDNAKLDATLELDHLISNFFQIARGKGYSLNEIQARVERLLTMQPPDHFLVIEPDPELRQIMVEEIREGTGFRVIGADLKDCVYSGALTGAALVALYTHAETVRGALPANLPCTLVHSRSIPEAVGGQKRPEPDELVAVASRWPDFLRWARAFLVAAGLDPDALSFRDAREKGWQKGLRSSVFVITDVVTGKQLPEGCKARVFRVISDSSLVELREMVGYLSLIATSTG
ncbi:MAG TPA: GntR family transcriptional regulator [Blastocatellia bacterium]|nr:GntR family transcriptional regulator [Blastocatellia bacterium]